MSFVQESSSSSSHSSSESFVVWRVSALEMSPGFCREFSSASESVVLLLLVVAFIALILPASLDPGTSRPKETRLRREVLVPGVRRMPGGLDGVPDPESDGPVPLLVAILSRVFRGSSWDAAGVPNKALLNARAANTGAGVSG